MKIKWKQVAMFAAAGGLFSLVTNLILKPDTIDMINVALVPELAEELGADLTTRLQLAHIGVLALDAIQGPPGTATPAGEQADAYGRAALERYGQQTFDLLTVEQRKQFYYMFRERKVIPVTYRTEPPPSGSGPAMFWLEFGWKEIDASMRASLPDTAARLERAWEIIPSKSVAKSLVDHTSGAVSTAADKWLAANAPQPVKKQALSGPYSEDKWARHDRKMAEARRDHEKFVADRERQRESQGSARDPLPSYEDRVAEMKRRHDERVAEMKREHARRVAEMKKKN